MSQDNEYVIHMQGNDQKEPERRPPSPQPTPERRKDIPAYEPEPLTESEPIPNHIEPDKGWGRE